MPASWADQPADEVAPGLQLLMVEETGCRFCLKWDKDVGTGYAASREGRTAPLKRIRRDAPELAGLKPVVYTPTFILMREAMEIGRITGYPGAAFFWEELDDLIGRSTERSGPASSPGPPPAAIDLPQAGNG